MLVVQVYDHTSKNRLFGKMVKGEDMPGLFVNGSLGVVRFEKPFTLWTEEQNLDCEDDEDSTTGPVNGSRLYQRPTIESSPKHYRYSVRVRTHT